MANNNQISSHKLLYSEIKERLKDQLDSIDSLDTKAGVTLGFSGAILIGLINSEWFLSLHYSLFLPIIIPLILTIILLVASVFVRSYRKDPNPTKLIEGYKDKSEEKTLGQLIRNFEDSFKNNVKPLENKQNFLNVGFIALGITVLAICFALFNSEKMFENRNHFNMYRLEVKHHGRY